MRAIPKKVREAIVRCYYKVKSIRQVCGILNVSKSSALSFVRKSKIGVSLEPSSHRATTGAAFKWDGSGLYSHRDSYADR